MQLGRHLRAIALSSLFAVAGAGAIAAPALARPKQPVDNGVRCSMYNWSTGEIVFYLPGENATTINGSTFVCGADGQWHDLPSAIAVPSSGSPTIPLTSNH